MSIRTGFSSAYRIDDGSAQAKLCLGTVRWAVQGFLVDRSISCSHRTIDFYNEKFDKFLSYLDQIGISNLNQLNHGVVNGYFHFATKQGQSAANSHCVGRAVKAFL